MARGEKVLRSRLANGGGWLLAKKLDGGYEGNYAMVAHCKDCGHFTDEFAARVEADRVSDYGLHLVIESCTCDTDGSGGAAP